jgi:O-antigen ligase
LKQHDFLPRLPASPVGKAIVLFISLICISPTIQLLLTKGVGPEYVFDFLILLIPDFAFLSIWIAFLLEKGKQKPELYLPDYALLGFVLLNVIWGFILSDDLVIAFKGFRITYLPILLYFLARFWQPKKETIASTLEVSFFILIVLALVGWILWLFFPELTSLMYEYSGHPVAIYFIVRMTSLLWTPVLFGTLMAWTAYFYFWRTLRKSTFLNFDLLYFLIAISGLIMSVSRGPLLSYLIAVVALIPFFAKWKKALVLVAMILAAQGIISISTMGNLKPLEWTISSTTSTVTMQKEVTRVSRWDYSINDFLAKPMGYGLGNAGAVAYEKGDSTNKAALSTDGWYLKLACETGLPGLISFVITLLVFVFIAWRNRFYSIDTLGFPILGLAFMIVVQCLSSNVLDFYPYIGFFWLLTGLSIRNKQAEVV